MSKFRYIFIGFMLTFLSSWVGLVLMPVWGLGNFEQTPDPATGEMIPPKLSSLEKEGRDVYIANGCVYCHSQQVHPARVRTDIARGWGVRRTVARDYMNQEVAQMGTMRTGPDLSNIGVRNPSETWHYLHLYNPQITSKGSNMPPFTFLFETKKKDPENPAKDALNLPEGFGPGADYEVTPSHEMRALVAYLQSLKLSAYEIPEAPAARIESLAE
ncbi:MAG: cbb3-type cytochrome c oxidase subunit II [Akkermansiaceae bacterium]|nr:cbb3-type cytochrome c oxidase subunit II [Akkermansiaceae bacterium]MDP4846906.1 cbb3-type cytochrome c oxidase subunit II [Akkermansiaceae bacterium]